MKKYLIAVLSFLIMSAAVAGIASAQDSSGKIGGAKVQVQMHRNPAASKEACQAPKDLPDLPAQLVELSWVSTQP